MHSSTAKGWKQVWLVVCLHGLLSLRGKDQTGRPKP